VSLRLAMVAALALTSAGCDAAPGRSIPLPLKLVADVPIEHPSSRFDYESLDPTTGLLFIADLAGSRVLVFDTRANRFVNVIDGIAKVHGVLAVPERGMVYASATGDDQLAAIDAKTFAVRARVASGHYPDGIAWAPKQGKLYVSDEHGNTVAVINAARNTLLAKIPVGGEVGNTQYDNADGMIYSNVQTRGEMVVIDPATDREVRRIKVPGCDSNHGLLIDPTRQLAYVACEDNARLVTVSLASKAMIDSQAVGSGPDVLAFDPGLKRLYVAAESGPLTVFDVSAEKPVRSARRSSRTMPTSSRSIRRPTASTFRCAMSAAARCCARWSRTEALIRAKAGKRSLGEGGPHYRISVSQYAQGPNPHTVPCSGNPLNV